MKKNLIQNMFNYPQGPKAELQKSVKMPKLPKSLTSEEKKYLLAVERGDTASVRRSITVHLILSKKLIKKKSLK